MNNENIADRLQGVEDMIQIDKLQKIYGYYLDNRKWDEVIDLFAEETESIEIGDRGVFKGKNGVRRFFLGYLARTPKYHGYTAIHMQHQGGVDVAPDGKTALGRWYCTMIQARPIETNGPIRSILGHGVYENEFVREGGTWKFSKVFYSLHYRSPIEGGWAETPMVASGNAEGYDAPPTAYHSYPDIGFVPFHWKHPVTGE